MFEGGRPRPSPRHQQKPRSRMMKLSSPRSRFSRMIAVKLEDDDSSSEDSNSSHNDAPSRENSVSIEEPPRDDTLRAQPQGDMQDASRSIGSTAPPDERPNSLLTHINNNGSMETTEAPSLTKSPRQPKSPRTSLGLKSPRATLLPKSPNTKNYQELNDETREVGWIKGSHSVLKHARIFRKSPKFKPEWQLKRRKILGSKVPVTPNGNQEEQEQNLQEKPEETVVKNKIPGASFFWPEIDEQGESRQDAKERPLPSKKEERQAPMDVPTATSLLAPSIRDSPRVFWPENDEQGEDRQDAKERQLPSKKEEMQARMDVPAAASLLAPSIRDSPRRGGSARQGRWSSIRERSRARSPSPSPQEVGLGLIAKPKLPLAVDSHPTVPIKTVITSPRSTKPQTYQQVEENDSDEEELEAIIQDLCPSGETFSTISSKDAFFDRPNKDERSAQQSHNKSRSEDESQTSEFSAAPVAERNRRSNMTLETAARATDNTPQDTGTSSDVGSTASENTSHASSKRTVPTKITSLHTPTDADEKPSEAGTEELKNVEKLRLPNLRSSSRDAPARTKSSQAAADPEGKSLESASAASCSKSRVSKPSPRLSRMARLRTMKANSPAVIAAVKNRSAIGALKHNLDATTSAVLQDEKASSVSSSVLDRSCLSNDEDEGNVASLTMSRVLDTSHNEKIRNNAALQKLLKQQSPKKPMSQEACSVDTGLKMKTGKVELEGEPKNTAVEAAKGNQPTLNSLLQMKGKRKQSLETRSVGSVDNEKKQDSAVPSSDGVSTQSTATTQDDKDTQATLPNLSRRKNKKRSASLETASVYYGLKIKQGSVLSKEERRSTTAEDIALQPLSKDKKEGEAPPPKEVEAQSPEKAKPATCKNEATPPPKTNQSRDSVSANSNKRDSCSQFPMINRSYRNTRLAKKYLHRRSPANGSANATNAYPKHALRDDSSVEEEGAASVAKNDETNPTKKLSLPIPTTPTREPTVDREAKSESPPSKAHSPLPPNQPAAAKTHATVSGVDFHKNDGNAMGGNKSGNKTTAESNPVASEIFDSTSKSAKTPVKMSLISVVTNKKDRLALLSHAQGMRPSSPQVNESCEKTKSESVDSRNSPVVEDVGTEKKTHSRLKNTSSHHLRMARASNLILKHRQVVAGVSVVAGVNSVQKSRSVAEASTSGVIPHHAKEAGESPRHAKKSVSVLMIDNELQLTPIKTVTVPESQIPSSKAAAQAALFNKKADSKCGETSADVVTTNEPEAISQQKINPRPTKPNTSVASTDEEMVPLEVVDASISAEDDSLLCDSSLSFAKSGELSTAKSGELSTAKSGELSTAKSGELSTAKSGELSTGSTASMGWPNDLVSRTARRRQHPAFATRNGGKASKSSNLSATSKKKTAPLANEEALAETKSQEKPKPKKVVDKSKTPAEKAVDELPNTPSMNSIFGENKGIAFAYWKYSQAKEASHVKKSKDRKKMECNVASKDQGTMERNASDEERDSAFVTKREENMHTFHELEADEGKSIAELTSAEITLSMGSGSSEESSSKLKSEAKRKDIVETRAPDPPECTFFTGLRAASPKVNTEKLDFLECKSESRPSDNDAGVGASMSSENAGDVSQLSFIVAPSKSIDNDSIADEIASQETDFAASVDDESPITSFDDGPLSVSFDNEPSLAEIGRNLLEEEGLITSRSNSEKKQNQFDLQEIAAGILEEEGLITSRSSPEKKQNRFNIQDSPQLEPAAVSTTSTAQSLISMPSLSNVDPDPEHREDTIELPPDNGEKRHHGGGSPSKEMQDSPAKEMQKRKALAVARAATTPKNLNKTPPSPPPPPPPTADEKQYNKFVLRTDDVGVTGRDMIPAAQTFHVETPKKDDVIQTAQSFSGKYSYGENRMQIAIPAAQKQIRDQRESLDTIPAARSFHVKTPTKPDVIPAAQSFSNIESRMQLASPVIEHNHTGNQRESPQHKQDPMPSAPTFPVNSSPDHQAAAKTPSRTPAMHRRHFSNGSSSFLRGKETQFKYQDLKSLSLQENSGGLEMQRSHDSDLPCDDDIFSGIDGEGVEMGLRMGTGIVQDPTEDCSENVSRNAPLPPPPPPPPPPPLSDNQFGRVLDEKATLRSVNSDITSSVLAGQTNPGDQCGKIISEDGATVTSDITSSLLAGGRVVSKYHYEATNDEVGFNLIDEIDETRGAESIDEEKDFLREYLSGPGPEPSMPSVGTATKAIEQSRSEVSDSPYFTQSNIHPEQSRSEVSDSPYFTQSNIHPEQSRSEVSDSPYLTQSNMLPNKSSNAESETNPEKKLDRSDELGPSGSQASDRPHTPGSLQNKPSATKSETATDNCKRAVMGASAWLQTTKSDPKNFSKSDTHPPLQPKAKHEIPLPPGITRSGSQASTFKATKPTARPASGKGQAHPGQTRSGSPMTIMDGAAIVKMGLAMMGSFSEGMMSLTKDMPSKDNLFGFSEDRGMGNDFSEDQALGVDSVETGATNDDTAVLGDANAKTNIPSYFSEEADDKIITSYYESEDSHSFPPHDHTISEDPDDAESAISLVLLEEVKTMHINASEEAEISVGHIEAVRKFSMLCQTDGIEVLKLNRRNKWQTRYLTVSSEILHLQHVGDLSQYPKALLWVKRFHANQSYSLDTISNERGGVEFARIESTEVENSENPAPKTNAKFKNSVQVNLHYACNDHTSRTLALRFKTQVEAEYFTASMDAIVDVLDHEGIPVY